MKTFKEFIISDTDIDIFNERVLSSTKYPELLKAQKEATRQLYHALDVIDKSMMNIVKEDIMKDSAIFMDFVDLRHKVSKWNTQLIDKQLFSK